MAAADPVGDTAAHRIRAEADAAARYAPSAYSTQTQATASCAASGDAGAVACSRGEDR